MNNFNERKLRLLQDSNNLIKAIDDEIDWFLLYISEKDQMQKEFFYKVYMKKRNQLTRLAKEVSKTYARQ